MEAITEAIENLIEFIELIYNFISNIFNGITVAFDIIGRIITLYYEFILTMPSYITAFAIITLVVSIIYFVIGREEGKSE